MSFKLNSSQNIMFDLASRFRDRRIAENLTQKDLASMLGVLIARFSLLRSQARGRLKLL